MHAVSVLVEAISVIVDRNAIDARFPGGWDAFVRFVPNPTLCADPFLARVGFMHADDVRAFVEALEARGLRHLRDGNAVDVVVVDQQRGPTTRCDWVEFGKSEGEFRVSACRRLGAPDVQLATPEGWTYEGSLSQTFGFTPLESVDRSLTFLRHDDGVDVYVSRLTGEEVYMGRSRTRK
ncbi:MAG: hypothetical protein AMXMBFR42_29810 [Burkholderiales bacterium]